MAKQSKQTIEDKKLSEIIHQRYKQYLDEAGGPEFKERQQRALSFLQRKQTVTKEDRELYERFVREVHKDREKNLKEGRKTFGDYKYIEALGINPDVVFIYGGKNIGKTYALAKKVSEILTDPKRQIMYLRNTRMELDKGFVAQLAEPEGPFTYIKSSGQLKRKPGYLYERGAPLTTAQKKRLKNPNYRKLSKKEQDAIIIEEEFEDETMDLDDPSVCGYATCLTGLGLRSYQGSGYSKLTDVIGDECNDVGDLDEADMKRFITFLLSLERNKPHMKVGLMGNLLRHDSNVATNIFMDHFGIPYDCQLKYGKEGVNGGRILYINTGVAGELFDGVDQQKATNLFGAEISEDLTSNQPLPPTVKVLNRAFFLCCCEPGFSFLVSHEKEYFIIYLGIYSNRESMQTFYVLKVERHVTAYNLAGYYPITDMPAISNMYGNVVYKKKRQVGKLVKKLFKMQKKRQVFFADDASRMIFTSQLFDKLVSRYKEELGDIF